MKFNKLIILSIFLVSLFIFACNTTTNSDQENPDPVLHPEDVFSQEILSQIRSHYGIGDNELEITYIGNHGYLFSTLSKKILIDSLSEIEGGYERTSRVILTMLNEAEFPFNNIDLALTTHSHGDHFNADSAVNFLIANSQTTHLSTNEVDGILQTSSGYNQIQSQSIGITPDPSTRYQTGIAEITVDVIRIDHHLSASGDEHVAFLFSLNGIKILHVGDACKIPAQYEGLGLEGENIDILVAPFGSSCANWTVGTEEENAYDIINQYIKPKHIIVSHLSFETTAAEIEATIDTLEENCPGITFSVFHPTILKQMIYIKEEGSIRVIDKPTS